MSLETNNFRTVFEYGKQSNNATFLHIFLTGREDYPRLFDMAADAAPCCRRKSPTPRMGWPPQ